MTSRRRLSAAVLAATIGRLVPVMLVIIGVVGCPPDDLLFDVGDVDTIVDGAVEDSPGMSRADAAVMDSPFDAALMLDSSAEIDAAFDCGACVAAAPCEVLVCQSACDYEPMADGTGCMSGGFVCVDAECVAPGCGNGWRDLGEGCDDGNVMDGDGCDVTCAPEVITLDERLFGIQAIVGAAAAGMDDEGNLLVAWVRELGPGAGLALMAQRFDRRLRAVDEVPVQLEVGPLANSPLAAVVPLRRGWALAWPSTTVDELGIAYLVASPTGSYPAPRRAHAPTSYPEVKPTLARTDEGFVIGWQSRFGFQLHVRARRFDARGTPISGDFAVTDPDMTPESIPVLFGRSSYGDASETDQSWSVAYVGGAAGQTLFADYDGDRPAGAPTQRVFHIPSGLIAMRDAGGVLVGTQTSAARGTVTVGWLDDTMSYTVDRDLVSLGGGAIDEDLAIAPVPTLDGAGEWVALWRSSNSDTQPMGMMTSPRITLPTSLSRVQDALVGVWEVEDISVGRAGPELDDGWIVTYVSITDSMHRLNVFHLTF